jgi:hypothetical protein
MSSVRLKQLLLATRFVTFSNFALLVLEEFNGVTTEVSIPSKITEAVVVVVPVVVIVHLHTLSFLHDKQNMTSVMRAP